VEPLRANAIRIAETKLALLPAQAFCRGVLANLLVCLAVWLAMLSQTVVGKFIGIAFPISAFVAASNIRCIDERRLWNTSPLRALGP
jgi:formate/nitrite transporter FocA (FNT family)